MKLPISWLKEYVDFGATPEDLARRLTFSGIEVEGITRLGEGLDGVIVGEVRRIDKHPGADRLQLCQVYDGALEVSVVCGASNFSVGDKAAFAPVGARLPGGMLIEKRKVRGVESHGMLCAEDELGLSADHGGILLVGTQVAAGTPLAATLGLPDVVLDLEITWNRPDCLSIIGIAREVSALYGLPLRLPSVDFPETGAPVEGLIRVTIADPTRCARYTGRALQGLRQGASPEWMRRRLTRCGVRPIGNLVDVTNYVMLECGQPLHAFDHAAVSGGHIVVRLARADEVLHTLDGVERRLTPDMLVIADEQRAVAVAGVMGGSGSEIGTQTVDVLLESAAFEAPGIHRTAVALGLSTESSTRFERGVDPELADWASRRAASLLLQVAGGTAARGVVDAYPRKVAMRTVACRYARVRALLGIEVADAEIDRIFTSLSMPVVAHTAGACQVQVPSFRRDIEIEADLIEEVARIHGLDQVPEAVPRATLSTGVDDSRTWAMTCCRQRLVALGLREVMHYSFLSEKILNHVGGDEPGLRVLLPNPVSSDYAWLRPSLLPQLIGTLGHNRSRQVMDAGFFEIGRIFQRRTDGVVLEAERVAIALMGRVGRGALDGRRPVEPEEMFLWLKGVLAALVATRPGAELKLVPTRHAAMEAGWCVSVEVGGTLLGVAGLLRRDLRADWRIAEPVGIAELSVDPLLAAASRPKQFEAVPVYPAITHDVAMLVAEDVRHETVVGVIRAAGPVELTEIQLFDIFRGRAVGAGRKSLAYSLVYRSAGRTLTDEEANQYDARIREALKRELNAEIREG